MSLSEDVALALEWTRCNRNTVYCWISPAGRHTNRKRLPDWENDLVASDALLETMRAEGYDMLESRHWGGQNALSVGRVNRSDAPHIFEGNLGENRCRAFLATRGD